MSAGMMAAAVRKRKRFPPLHGTVDGQRNDVHIASLTGIDDAEAAVAATCKLFGNPLRPSPADVLERDGADVLAGDGAAHLLANVIFQVR